MLAADKLLLQSNLKQRATQLREKELNLFNDNFNAVGTQSAVLAGFAMTSFAEIDLPKNAYYAHKAVLHVLVTISICANLLCTAGNGTTNLLCCSTNSFCSPFNPFSYSFKRGFRFIRFRR